MSRGENIEREREREREDWLTRTEESETERERDWLARTEESETEREIGWQGLRRVRGRTEGTMACVQKGEIRVGERERELEDK